MTRANGKLIMEIQGFGHGKGVGYTQLAQCVHCYQRGQQQSPGELYSIQKCNLHSAASSLSTHHLCLPTVALLLNFTLEQFFIFYVSRQCISDDYRANTLWSARKQ